MLVPPPPVLPPPPPHASTPPVRATRNASIPSIVRQLRRRAGIPKSRMQARATPPVVYQGTPLRLGRTRAALVAAVVVKVSVAVPAEVPVMLTGLVEPKLKVGGYRAPAGLEVTAAVSVTLPLKPPAGVTVMAEVFAFVAPGETVTAVPLTVKLGGGAVTVTEVVPVFVI